MMNNPQPCERSYQIIFIDWYRTLSTSLFSGHWAAPWHPRHNDFDRIQTLWRGELQLLLTPWMRGSMRSEQFVATVADRLACDFDELMAEFIEGCRSMTLVSDELPSIIRQVRERGVRVVIATDNMDCFTRWTVPPLGLDTMFDDILCSHELGLLKCDIDARGRSSFFASYLERHGVGIGDCLLLDDSIVVGQAAEACGIRCRNISSASPLVVALRQFHADVCLAQQTRHT